MAAKYWTCRKCGYRNDRRYVKCRGIGDRDGALTYCTARRPKRPVRAHQKALRDLPYSHYVNLSAAIHGVTDESCCVCGKPRTQERHHDRDHDHRTGQARGLACGGNQGCNVLMLPWISASVARAISGAKMMRREPDAERWSLVAAYLERVEAHYAENP